MDSSNKAVMLFAAVTLVWAGSLWMAFWSGFSSHLSVATVAAHGADRVRQIENERLLKKIESGDVESARASLSELVRLDGELIEMDKKIPKLGLTDIALAGLTSPRALIGLLETARRMDDAPRHPQSARAPAAKTKITGVYSNLRYNLEGGDLLGMELIVVPSEAGYIAFVQIAEGGTPYTAVVPIVVAGQRISFMLPPGGAYGGTRFDGDLKEASLVLHSPTGVDETLKRGRSYWQ